MSPEAIVAQANEYLSLMSELTPPSDLYFRSYTDSGVLGIERLCAAASTLATGENDTALASLVVLPGSVDAFELCGAHARATLSVCHTPFTRLYVILGILITVIVIVFTIFRSR